MLHLHCNQEFLKIISTDPPSHHIFTSNLELQTAANEVELVTRYSNNSVSLIFCNMFGRFI